MRGSKTSQALALAARTVLGCATGRSDTALAAKLGTVRTTVSKWRKRFIGNGLEGVPDRPPPGAPRPIGDDEVEHEIVAMLDSLAPAARYWSTRSMAAKCGLGWAAVPRTWQALAIKRHRHETFKLSKDPQFVSNVREIVALHMHPPERAIVLSIDEKSQIQAFDPTQPGLPECRTHRYRRHGMTSLFDALNIATGKVIHG